MLKICYYEDFKTKGIIKNDESHHLTLIRIKYSNNIKFLEEISNMFRETELSLVTDVRSAIDGYKDITQKFRDMEDLSMSIKFTTVIYNLSKQSKDIDVMLSTQF